FKKLEKGIEAKDSHIYSQFVEQKLKQRNQMVFNELFDFFENLSKPSDKSKAYIFAHEINHESIRILMTTKKLILYFKQLAVMQIDMTYKLLDIGFPIVIVRLSDSQRIFIPIIVGVVKMKKRYCYMGF
ncbi:hypothetical protein BB558_002168, partial [Smittium angustum]